VTDTVSGEKGSRAGGELVIITDGGWCERSPLEKKRGKDSLKRKKIPPHEISTTLKDLSTMWEGKPKTKTAPGANFQRDLQKKKH